MLTSWGKVVFVSMVFLPTQVSPSPGKDRLAAQRIEIAVNVVFNDSDRKLEDDSSAKVVATSYERGEAHGGVGLIRFETSAAGEAKVALPPGRWVLEAEAEGYWSTRAQLVVGQGDKGAMLELWPAGAITGGMIVPRGEMPPERVDVLFRSAPEVAEEKRFPPSTVSCQVKKTAWTCRLPAGLLDLRVQPATFVPRYQWGVNVKRGETVHLGRFHLARGSAVLGWVTTIDGSSPVDGKVELRLLSGPTPDRGEQARIAGRSFSTRINDRGFFQINGVPPGAYLVEATHPPFAPARTSVRVVAGEITEIANPPLLLNFPQTLEVFLSPPVDPWGRQWTMELARQADPASPVVDPVAAETVPPSGALTVSDLAPGSYYLRVRSAAGDSWWTGNIEVDPSLTPLFVDLPVIEIEGSLHLGDDALAATLWFGGRWGASRIELMADEDGQFHGFLPRGGDWIVGIRSEEPRVERELRKVPVERPPGQRVARVELTLPNTLLAGRVVDEARVAVVDASVRVKATGRFGGASQASVDEDGRFEFQGLPPGPTEVAAHAGPELSSDTVILDLVDGQQIAELEVVVRPTLSVTGYVQSGQGAVAGAQVSAVAIGMPQMTSAAATTDARGWFELALPWNTREMKVTIAAPGFAFRLFRVRVSADKGPMGFRVVQEGGTLIIETDQPFDWWDPEGAFPFVLHGGTYTGLPNLIRWATLAGGSESPTRWVIPQVEPGDYSFCVVSAVELPALDAGAIASSRCDPGGHLSPNGELILQRPTLREPDSRR